MHNLVALCSPGRIKDFAPQTTTASYTYVYTRTHSLTHRIIKQRPIIIVCSLTTASMSHIFHINTCSTTPGKGDDDFVVSKEPNMISN